MPIRDKKILVVDDARVINELLVDNLREQLGIEVSSARDMTQAMKFIERDAQAYFLAVLDLNLPDAPDGEIVDYMMEHEIPSIVLTCNSSAKMQKNIMDKGVIDFVNKANLNEIQFVIDSARRLYENFGREVIVVDDSDVSRMLLTSLLKRLNLKVFEAINGVQALKLLKAHKNISLIITDYNMPKMDGIELIYNIRKEYSRDELAIIGISATNDNIVSVKLLKAGANDCIARPFAHEEFNCRINQNIDAIVSYKKLKDATIKDFLTDLYNRKYIFDTGEKLFKNAQRNNIQLTTAMIDVDFFKHINDNYGHHVGDLALKHVSKILIKELRDGDILARIGGEEFCILCINLNDTDAKMVFERIRKSVEETPLVLPNCNIKMTISIGYNPHLSASLDQMIDNADKALYEAKKTSRNKVVYLPD